MKGYERILLAVDISPENQIVATRAAELARGFSAQLSILHVVEYVPLDLGNELVLPQQQEIEIQLVARAEQRLKELAVAIGMGDAEQKVICGSVKVEIVQFAAQQGVDLIVIGRHCRRGIFRLLGSTANAVLHAAECDVLAVNLAE